MLGRDGPALEIFEPDSTRKLDILGVLQDAGQRPDRVHMLQCL